MNFVSSFKKAVIIISAYMIPIFLIGKYYRDDYYRINNDSFGWSEVGRPFSDIIIFIINFGEEITDVSPFAQILVIIICAATCAIIATYLLRSDSFFAVSCASFIFISPFYLQNLMYRFDAITMSFSIFICTVPFVKLDFFSNKRVAAISFSCMLIALMTYQASIPVFFSLVLLDLIMVEHYNSSVFKRTLTRIISGTTALLIYIFIVSPLFISGDYAENHAEISFADGIFDFIWIRLVYYVTFLSFLTDEKWLVIFFIPLCLMNCALILFVRKNEKEKMTIQWSILLSLSALIISIIMFFMLKSPVFQTRVMIGFNALTMVMMCLSFHLLRNRTWMLSIVVLIPMAYYFSIGSNFVNAVKSQYEYEKSLLTMIALDVRGLFNKIDVNIYGLPKKSIINEKIGKRYNIISNIIQYDIGGWITSDFAKIESPYITMTERVEPKEGYDLNELCGTVKKEWNDHYMITENNDTINISFDKISCPDNITDSN